MEEVDVAEVVDVVDLTSLTAQAPAAVLLVDLGQRAVVHANPVARQLAPTAQLPLGIDAWSDAAQLRDLAGAELSETDHPLSKVARSEPVTGEAVSAASSSDLGARREPLWVVGLPMVDAPMLTDHALVVLLPLRDRHARRAVVDAADAANGLRERAVLATGLSFTVADARVPDMPLVWVNPAFTATTGYSSADVVGRNCRFLQGPGTDPAGPAALGAALRNGESATVTLLNYRKDGLAFWNQVAMSPVFGAGGELTHFVGLQTDVSGRVAADADRDAALDSERRARTEAEEARRQAEAAHLVAERARFEAERARAQAELARSEAEAHRTRLALLARASERLSGTLDVAECRRRLVELAVPQLGDWAVVLTSGRDGRITDATCHGRDPALLAAAERYARAARRSGRSTPLHDQLLGGVPARRIVHVDSSASPGGERHGAGDPAVASPPDAQGTRSLLVAALPGRSSGDDLIVLARHTDAPVHTEEDLQVCLDVARRAGLALENARLFQTQQHIASTLQASLMPELPAIAGVDVAARHVPAQVGADVGGDFYEVIDLPGPGFAFVIGDVIGHDVHAAAAMGQLKGLLRACAWDGATTSPAAVLQRVDEIIAAMKVPTMATATIAHLVRRDLDDSDDVARSSRSATGPSGTSPLGTSWVLRCSSAGHPPLLVRRPDGSVHVLDTAGELPLGIDATFARHSHTVHLEAGSTVLAYTDGLVERRDEDIDTGLARLAATAREAPSPVQDFARHLLSVLGRSVDDDIALLALTV